MSRAGKKLLAVLVGFAFFGLGMEVVVRGWHMWKGRGFFTDEMNVVARARSHRIPFRTYGFPAYRKVNGSQMISSTHQELFSIEKPPGVYRFVSFGGSTTANNYSNERGGGHYPLVLEKKLEERLGIEVEGINVGFSAYTTAHALILLILDVQSWDPDLVILSNNYNDLQGSYFPDFTMDYHHYLGADMFMRPTYGGESAVMSILFQHSALYWLVEGMAQRAWTRLTQVVQRRSYGMDPPGPGARVFRRNVETFVEVAKSRGFDVLLASQALEPTEEYFLRHVLHKPYNHYVFYPLHEEFLSHHATFNRILADVAADEGVAFLDNDGALGGRSEYFIDFIHYSVAGIGRLTDSYADFLTERIHAARNP